MSEPAFPEDPYPATLPTQPQAPTVKPPVIIRFVHVAAHGDAHSQWAMGWVNQRIADLEAEIVAIAHACSQHLSLEPPLYSTVICYQCPAWSPPIPPIPPYPEGA